MAKPANSIAPASCCRFHPAHAVLALFCALTLLTALSARAQTFTVLHTFSGPDGSYPYSGVTLDAAGNMYGTTYSNSGGAQLGTVYQLKHRGSGYLHNQLHEFAGGSDGQNPYGGVIFGPDGPLYGTTWDGGTLNSGVVFSLRPPFTFCRTALCPWTESLAYNDPVNAALAYGNIAVDPAGNMYGTSAFGGNSYGTVYEMSRSGNNWMGSVIYKFQADDLNYPGHNVIVDAAGNLYGTTGGPGEGGVFQLTRSGSGWTESIIADFGLPQTCPGFDLSGLIMDAAGNLYGATTGDGETACVFEMSNSGGSWQFSVLYTFNISNNGLGAVGNMVFDSHGNLWGTTKGLGAFGLGNIFKLTRSGNAWTYTDVYDFSDNGDGAYPTGDLTIDSAGNIYGTNQGTTGHGVVWMLTP
jgi:hypothetical protein